MDMNFHIYPKLGRIIKWITMYPSPSFNNYHFMADLVLSLRSSPFLFIHFHIEFLRVFKGSHGILPCGDNNYSLSLMETRLSCNFIVWAQPSKKELTHFPRHSSYMLRGFHQSYKRRWHFQFKLKRLIKPEGWVIEDI